MIAVHRNLFVFLLVIVLFVSSYSGSHALEPMDNSEMQDVTAKKGLTIDLEFKAVADFLRYTDRDGNSGGNPGYIQLGEEGTNDDFVIDDPGGGAVSLTGLSLDVDGSTGGSPKLVVGGPDGKFRIRSEAMFLGGTSTSVFDTTIDDIDLSNTSIAVGGQ